MVMRFVQSKSNNTLSNYGYTNDALGRRTAMARSGSLFTVGDTLSYSYNDRSEVTGATSNAAITTYNYAYSFDNIGNRLTANLAGTPWTYTANNLNQYSAFTINQVAETPSYDDDGNMLTRDGWTQTWNGENRLIKAEKGTAKLEFAYDYMGRRIFKKVYSGSTLTKHIRFVYDGYKLIEELNAQNNNAVLRRYTWLPVGLDTPVSVYDAAANATYYYNTDANKNITELTDSTGAVVAHYEYSPFGGVVTATGAYAEDNPFRFSSEYYDPETSLVYYNFRYYSPTLGRWIKPDPIEEQGGYNLYAMVKNNVIDNWDIRGLVCAVKFDCRLVSSKPNGKCDVDCEYYCSEISRGAQGIGGVDCESLKIPKNLVITPGSTARGSFLCKLTNGACGEKGSCSLSYIALRIDNGGIDLKSDCSRKTCKEYAAQIKDATENACKNYACKLAARTAYAVAIDLCNTTCKKT